jgi:hypothetical protein
MTIADLFADILPIIKVPGIVSENLCIYSQQLNLPFFKGNFSSCVIYVVYRGDKSFKRPFGSEGRYVIIQRIVNIMKQKEVCSPRMS